MRGDFQPREWFDAPLGLGQTLAGPCDYVCICDGRRSHTGGRQNQKPVVLQPQKRQLQFGEPIVLAAEGDIPFEYTITLFHISKSQYRQQQELQYKFSLSLLQLSCPIYHYFTEQGIYHTRLTELQQWRPELLE